MFHSPRWSSFFLALALSSTPLIASAAAEDLKAQQQNDVSFVSGGISNAEQQAIKQMGRDYSLMVTFAIPAGNYLSGGTLQIRDGQGNTVLDVETKGPIFYADLEPGTYTVSAEPLEYEEQRAERTVEIGEDQSAVHFAWDI